LDPRRCLFRKGLHGDDVQAIGKSWEINVILQSVDGTVYLLAWNPARVRRSKRIALRNEDTMSRPFALVAAAILAFGASAAASAAELSVVFVHPEKFTDAVYSHPYGDAQERDVVLRDVERHLQGLADRGLPPGDSLRIEVLDIDLAGWFEPWRFRSYSNVRILRDITWPRIKLNYTLKRGDQVLASAEEQVVDLNYLMTVNRYSPDDRLRYEKAMLDEWFDKRIVRPVEHS
jgi:hypothetical protein